MNTDFLNKIPEFSERNFKYATYVSSGLIGCASLYFIYMIFTTPDFGIEVQWNMFKSMLFGPLYIIGLLLSIVYWGKFGHWSGTPIIKTYDEYGNHIKTEKNYDIIETLLWKVVFPLLGHFLIEPCAYAALIYYPIMIVVAAVAAVLNYVLALLLIGVTVCMALYGQRLTHVRCHSLIVVVATLILAGGLSTWAYCMGEPSGMARADLAGNDTETTELVGDTTSTADNDESATDASASTEIKKGDTSLAGIIIGKGKVWKESVDGIYDSYTKKTEQRYDEEGEYNVTFYEFKKDGKTVIQAYAGDDDIVSSIDVLGENIMFEGGLHVGCPAVDVYNVFTPNWEILFDEAYNVRAHHGNITYCMSSDDVVEGKDCPEQKSDIKSGAKLTCIKIEGVE